MTALRYLKGCCVEERLGLLCVATGYNWDQKRNRWKFQGGKCQFIFRKNFLMIGTFQNKWAPSLEFYYRGNSRRLILEMTSEILSNPMMPNHASKSNAFGGS